MLFNTVFGLIIPWIFGIWLIGKDKKLVFIIVPISSIVSHAINSFGFHGGYWKVVPIERGTFSVLPFDLGLYSILGCFLIFLIKRSKYSPYITIFLISFLTTLLELFGVVIDRVIYQHGWNIFYTFFSYLMAYVLVYWYYLVSKKLDIFH